MGVDPFGLPDEAVEPSDVQVQTEEPPGIEALRAASHWSKVTPD
jgi:hypothetical protein